MKRFIAVVLVLVLCVGMAGCDSSDNNAFGVSLTEEKIIHFGDNRETVEKLVGDSGETDDTGWTYYIENTLGVRYRDDLVSGIILNGSGMKLMDIEVGADINNVSESINGEPLYGKIYAIQVAGNEIKYLSSEENIKLGESSSEDDIKQAYQFELSYTKDGFLDTIYIWDGLYVYKNK